MVGIDSLEHANITKIAGITSIDSSTNLDFSFK